MENTVRVYSTDALSTMVEESKQLEQSPRALRTTVKQQKRPHTIGSMRHNLKSHEEFAAKKMQEAKQRRLQKYWDNVDRQRAEAERVRKIEREKTSIRKEEKFREMLDSLVENQAIVDGVEQVIQGRHMSENRRKSNLYKTWNRKVYRPIQGQIDAKLGSRSVSEIQARRNRNMQEFLDISNKNGGVFRDIVIKEDYDPFKERNKTITYNQANLKDPCKQDIRKLAIENKMIDALNPDTVRIEPKGREVLDTMLWDKLDSTPYARYGGLEQKVYRRPAQPIPGCPARSFNSASEDLHLDHYNEDTIDRNRQIVKAQFFKGGVKIADPSKYIGRRITDHWPEA